MTTLSAREQQVAWLIMLGKDNRTIAEALAITRRTVESHREAIFKKRGVRNAVELVRQEYGLDELDSV